MKKNEGVVKLPRRRREAALASPYTKEEFIDSSQDADCKNHKNFSKGSLALKYFKM
ncbi:MULTISPECIES: hypothetical protein [Enterobacter]|uniref:hypothetical protein n=1 Tax=Enterobacter TaxID=547 RepID=UPI00142E4F6E|nr:MULTISPECIES: hypothetical protein [Enterobacter]EHN8936931.1 hypothetical protein [Enterobacter hormaechei]EKS7193760.1 hypothetical protein [Enterobacter ludwigii]EKS7207312.1 hypothetical protein [Enterobacter ludwigii]MBE1254590.1 hypothetical protein [Enterobacter cloacae]MCM7533968.1 hypothetical protein [Enterobacter hormaechei]